MHNIREYLESEIEKKTQVARNSNVLLIERMRDYQAQLPGRTITPEDVAFFITDHRNVVELLTLTTLYCRLFSDSTYVRDRDLLNKANKFVRISELNLTEMR